MRVKYLFISAFIIVVTSFSARAQQWQGTNPGPIYYNGGNVGIGTSTPAIKLHVLDGHIAASTSDLAYFTQLWSGNAIIWKSGSPQASLRFGSATDLNAANWSEKMRITDAGNVGIGTYQPSARLEIANSGSASLRVGVSSNMANTYAQVLNSLAVIGNDNSTITSNIAGSWDYYNNGNNPSWAGTLIQHVGTAVSGSMFGAPASNLGTLVFQNVSNGVIASNGANIFISPLGTLSASFLTNGNVGIGTTDTKGYKFAVNGSAVFTKVVVKQNQNWPDYVFHNNYNLPSLGEVEQYIQQNHHLPEMPSAAQVEKDGLNLGDNQATLLKKIEELTLYVIEQNKKQQEQQHLIEEQRVLLQQQQQRLEAMEKRLKSK